MKMIADVRIFGYHVDHLISEIFRMWRGETNSHVPVDPGDLFEQHIKGHAALLLSLVDRLEVFTMAHRRIFVLLHRFRIVATIRIHVLTEQGDFFNTRLGQQPHLVQYGLDRSGALTAARVGHHTVGAHVVTPVYKISFSWLLLINDC